MKRLFVSTRVFDSLWLDLGLHDADRVELEGVLLQNPGVGKVIPGSGGLRKLRWGLPGRGKRGGIRILYADFPRFGVTYLLSLISKSERENITPDEKRVIKALIAEIEDNLGGNS